MRASPSGSNLPVRKPSLKAFSYLEHVVPGLEDLAARELRQRVDGQIDEILKGFDERTSLIRFRSPASPAALLDLRLAEDVLALAAADQLESEAGVQAVRSAIGRSKQMEAAISAALTSVKHRRGGKLTFRVVARKAGRHRFRRIDLQRETERAILERVPSWRLVDEHADLEIWVQLINRQLVAGIRLSSASLRHRDYLRVSLPAALKPTIAAAMVMLSEPRDDDVFLDPMCGTGTILIERALAGRYRVLLGGDSDSDAVEAARTNIGPRFKPIEIREWDARHLPLDDHSVTAIVTNMPFGKRVGSEQANRRLYPALLDEWSRVLDHDGRMVLLTGDAKLVRSSIERRSRLVVGEEVPVLVRGVRARIVQIRPRGEK